MASGSRISVVFVSKRNSLRSVLAHACLEHLGGKRFTVLSCGDPLHVADAIHPAALGALAGASMAVPDLVPAGWNELKSRWLAKASFVITLDSGTLDHEPSWPGQPDSALWDTPDVSMHDAQAAAVGAIQVLYALRRRIELFISLTQSRADRRLIRDDVRDLGRLG